MLLFISERREYKNTHRDLLIWTNEIQEGQTACGDWFLRGRWEGVGRGGEWEQKRKEVERVLCLQPIFVNVCY